MKFKYRVVFFHQEACPACSAMKPLWEETANELAQEYPQKNIGFGSWDVNEDNWDFADKIGVDGTPNFAVFDEDSFLIAVNTDGMLSKSELKSFIVGCLDDQ